MFLSMAKYVIQLRTFRGGTYSRLSKQILPCITLNAITCILMRQALRDTHTQRRRHTKQQEAGRSGGRAWSHTDTSQGMWAATESWERQRVDVPLESHREHSPANTVSWAPGFQNHTDRQFSFFKPPRLWQCVTGDLGSQYTSMMKSTSLWISILQKVSIDAQIGALLFVTTL